MSRPLYEKISRDKLEAYLEGRLNEHETAEVDALVDGDKMLQGVVDEYFSIQIELANAENEQQDGNVSLESIEAMNKVIARVQESESDKDIVCLPSVCCYAVPDDNNCVKQIKPYRRKRTIRIIVGAACLLIVFLLGYNIIWVNYFMPINTEGVSCENWCDNSNVYYGEEEECYGSSNVVSFGGKSQYDEDVSDTDIDYEEELAKVDYLINQKSKDNKNEAYELYELQWERIRLLSVLKRNVKLRIALEEYVKIEGCHRKEAMCMLEELK